jgi:AraC-like DNA-binding protein
MVAVREETRRREVPTAGLPPERYLSRARDLVDARYGEPLTVDDMAGAAGLSKAHFSVEFRRAFGISPHVYLLTRRLERAAALLRMTDRSVADICMSVGLSSVGSFTETFRRTFGLTPTAYRAAYPPAAAMARVPACVLRAYGVPQHRTFREDDHRPLLAASGSSEPTNHRRTR